MKTSSFVAEKTYKRLDGFLSEVASMTRSHAKKLCEDGLVVLNCELAKASQTVKEGEVVLVTIEDARAIDLSPADIPLDIVFQDDYIAVINKPQGLTVHAGGGTRDNTLVNALLFHLDNLSGINGELRPGIVHRIDKDTSGLLVVAKCDEAHLSLSRQIEKKTCKREYIALLEGVVKPDNGHIETLIVRSDKDRKMMCVSNSKGRKADTNFEVVKRYKDFTLCRFTLGTGRTHQIRVHAKHIGHPVVGDKVYGYKKQKFALDGQLLHAFRLTLTHPSTGETMTFEAPLPEYFQKVLDVLDKKQ